MSSNVGLTTPRGSGTSGYVQRNLSALKHRDRREPYPKDFDQMKHRQRQPDPKILAHDRARAIEVKVFELRDELEEKGVDEEEIEERTDALRKKLTSADAVRGNSAKGLKRHQVHEMAAAKIEESERLRKALGISEDYEEGSHWKKQEERAKGLTKPEQAPNEQNVAQPEKKRRDASVSSVSSRSRSNSRSRSRSRSRSPGRRRKRSTSRS